MIDETHIKTASEEGERLARAFKRGEKGAYQAIYDRYYQRVEGICRRMLGNPHDSQEATQEAMLRVYQGLPRFNGRYQLGAWIARISTNVCLDHLRARGRHPDESVDLDELAYGLSSDTADEPEHVAVRRAETRRVRKVLESLPPLHRAAIVLRDFEGLSYAEIAETLSLTECQVKALLHRARKGFKRSWSPLAGLFLPLRFLPRVRKIEPPNPDQTIRAARAAQPVAEAAPNFVHAASTCSAVLQQCGQFVGERFAAVATGVVVGAAAIGGGGVAPASHQQQVKQRTVDRTNAGRRLISERSAVTSVPEKKNRKSSTVSGSAPSGVEQPAPKPSPTPTPSPSATTMPGSSDSGSQSGSNPPSSNPGSGAPPAQKQVPPQEPFTVALGFDRGQTIPASKPESQSSTVNCERGEVVQEVRTQIWDGEASYPAKLALRVGSVAAFDLSITKNGTDFTYNGGAGSVTTRRTGDKLELTFSGSYGWNGGPSPGTGNLPTSGRFSAKLSLDCTASRVVTESIRLFTE